jgi:hypothetical protein
MDFLRFDENGKIEEHWVSIQKNLMKPKTIISCIKIIPKVSRCTVYMLNQKTKTKTQDVGKQSILSSHPSQPPHCGTFFLTIRIVSCINYLNTTTTSLLDSGVYHHERGYSQIASIEPPLE